MSANPLLIDSPWKDEAVAFDDIKIEHFVPALDTAIASARQGLERVKAQTQAANFANTILALDAVTSQVYDIAYIYSNLRSANGDEKMQALAQEVMPRLIKLESDINLDSVIFERVRQVYEALPSSALDVESRTLVERTYRSFRRNGGLLDAAGKQRLRDIDAELSTLGPKFSQNVLRATNQFELYLTRAEELAGLPQSAIDAAAHAAAEKAKPGQWLFTLQAPSMLAFLKYADSVKLREQLWRAFSSRAFEGESSNRELIKRLVALKYERARLLGYESHAHFQMEERMAEHPDKVAAFLQRLLNKTKPAALREMQELQAFKQEHQQGANASKDLQPWDYAYWSTKLKEQRYQLSAEALRPYFELNKVLAGAFEHARRLYDLDFQVVKDVPVYASDVQVFEVKVASTGEYMGLFYADFFPRSTKSQGAWCTRFKSQFRKEDGSDRRPHVSIVCNFTPPTVKDGQAKPSLLSFQEVRTLFHEFGHALHSLLSRCQHRSLSCTSVYRDFVELPSQIMENWITDREGLAIFARHYQTGEMIPDDMVQRIIEGENFHAAYQMMRQLRFSLLDLAWYSTNPRDIQDIIAFEAASTAVTDVLPNVPGTNISCSFEHIFSGGYAAGYYGYKWAEVLDADAFELFKERGVFTREVADRFRQSVLERGGSEHPMRLYKEFRGREPDPDALLRRSGLL